jgi:ribosomal protein S18 acetylase RimI-like enzyme
LSTRGTSETFRGIVEVPNTVASPAATQREASMEFPAGGLSVTRVDKKCNVESYYRSGNVLLHLYELGDLDQFFWPHTTWYALTDAENCHQTIVLLYAASDIPVLLALSPSTLGLTLVTRLLASGSIPPRFYSHLSTGLRDSISPYYDGEYHGRYWKMGLTDFRKHLVVAADDTVRLHPDDHEQILTFYATHYPGNWFDYRMLETLQTFGVYGRSFEGGARGELIAVAGVHVFSKEYKVAALGNIAVHTDFRGRGLAYQVTAALIQSLLLEGIEHVGLNVCSTNGPAIACYHKLGFEKVGEYDEVMWTKKI